MYHVSGNREMLTSIRYTDFWTLGNNKSSQSNLWSVHQSQSISHNYTTKSPMVSMGCSKFTPKLPFPFESRR